MISLYYSHACSMMCVFPLKLYVIAYVVLRFSTIEVQCTSFTNDTAVNESACTCIVIVCNGIVEDITKLMFSNVSTIVL